MQVGQFLSGLVNGSIDRKQTSNVDKLLSEESLKFLYDLGREKKIQESTYIYVWPKENAISKTTIKPSHDNDGRTDLVNYTIIIKFDDILSDILNFSNLLQVVEKNLTPLQIEVKG